MSRRRAATVAAVVQLALMVGIGGVLILAGLTQASTPAPARVQQMRPATEAERRQWDVDQLADLLRAQQEAAARPRCEHAVPDC